jgi:hypothetical protein
MRTKLACAAFIVLAAATTAGCGGGGGSSGESSSQPTVAKPADFPRPDGRSLVEMRSQVASGPVLAPAQQVLVRGRNRFAFALFDRARKQISDAAVAVYVQPEGGGRVLGPFVAHDESLAVQAPYRSQTVANDPAAAHSVYVANIRLPKVGNYNLLGVARLDDRLVAADPAAPTRALARSPVPGVGEKAIPVDTPTVASAGSIEKIDTRQPHDDMHDVSLKDVLGKKPVVLLFATPALCQSRVCGPVADITEQLKAKYGKQAAFIHMEIYNDNDVSKGFRSQVLAWHLPTEPWLFTIKADGTIAARIEGAFSAGELDAAIKKAL